MEGGCKMGAQKEKTPPDWVVFLLFPIGAKRARLCDNTIQPCGAWRGPLCADIG